MSVIDIPLIRPRVRFEDVEPGFRKVLESGRLTSGPFAAQFEHEVAAACQTEHAVSTTSATTAIHLALHAVGVGPGDEVAIADFTFPATANAVIQTGATPVMIDSGSADFSMCPSDLEARLTARTAAVVPVDPFGQPADYEEIAAVVAERNIPIIADAACSLGASRSGLQAGAHGDMACFSFHPRKIVTCGEGGMITTDDRELAERLRSLRSHGAVPSTTGMLFTEPGFNYRMSELQAVMGLSQIGQLDQIMADRRDTAQKYDARLSDSEAIQLHLPPRDTLWSYQSYVVVLGEEVNRDRVIVEMRNSSIETTIGTYACHAHPAYEQYGYRPGDLKNSYRFQQQALTLPLLPNMEAELVDRVCDRLLQIVGD